MGIELRWREEVGIKPTEVFLQKPPIKVETCGLYKKSSMPPVSLYLRTLVETSSILRVLTKPKRSPRRTITLNMISKEEKNIVVF